MATIEKGVQVNLPAKEKPKQKVLVENLSVPFDTNYESGDSDWMPSSDQSDQSGNEGLKVVPVDWQSQCNQNPYLVFESCLMTLFTYCLVCFAPIVKVYKRLCGSMLCIETECLEGHNKIWFSQPTHKRMPWGNFAIPAACLFSGCQPSKLMTFLHHLNMANISNSTYYAIQRAYLIPSVISVWHESQRKMFQFLRGRTVVLGGHARMDSPGHMAKYGSYRLMDLGTSMILDTQLIQVILQTFFY